MSEYDIIIRGSGAGGGSIAHALAASGKKILIIERGGYLIRSKDNWNPDMVFRRGIYNAPERWYINSSLPIHPKQYYFVGGNTKFYGSVLVRFRERDFEEYCHEDGISPAWPISYAELEPFYCKAEELMDVQGQRTEIKGEPRASAPYPRPPLPHPPDIADLLERFSKQELEPAHSPLSLQTDDTNPLRSNCILCDSCDGYPCLLNAKNDAENRLISPVAKRDNVTLLTGMTVRRLETDSSGRRVTTVVAQDMAGAVSKYRGGIIILSAGAMNSALIMLASRSDKHPNGLANSSGLVGRNLMLHNMNIVVAADPSRRYESSFPKTFLINDFYFGDLFDPGFDYPLGNIQPLGKINAALFRAMQPLLPISTARYLERHTVSLAAIGEDLPLPENRVMWDKDGRIRISYSQTNQSSFRRLSGRLTHILKRAGFPLTVSRPSGPDATGHQSGTVRFGDDPATSVLDPYCKAYDLENLYVVDAGCFPSSTALNPALTIMANALRVAEQIIANYSL
jgi:choline dehydrogenase-like flavoprotein